MATRSLTLTLLFFLAFPLHSLAADFSVPAPEGGSSVDTGVVAAPVTQESAPPQASNDFRPDFNDPTDLKRVATSMDEVVVTASRPIHDDTEAFQPEAQLQTTIDRSSGGSVMVNERRFVGPLTLHRETSLNIVGERPTGPTFDNFHPRLRAALRW